MRWRPDVAKTPDGVLFQVLELSRMWEADDVREYVINQLDRRRVSIRPVQLISIAKEYKIRTLFTYAFARLVKSRLDDLTANEYKMMDGETWAAVLKAQSVIRTHHGIVGCEEPPMVHAPACVGPEDCSLDWKQLWWNQMGRFLFDGRNPQPYKDAVQHFEEVGAIGWVSQECWRSMMITVHAGLAFQKEDMFIEHTAKREADQLLL